MVNTLRFDRLGWTARPRLVTLALLAAMTLIVWELRGFGQSQIGVLLLLPVLYAGIWGGVGPAMVCALTAFVLAHGILNGSASILVFVWPREAVLLLVLVTTALVIGLLSLSERTDRSRRAHTARAHEALLDANYFFLGAVSEAAIRQRLADAMSQVTAEGAAVCDQDGDLIYRAGGAERWGGGLDSELVQLARESMHFGKARPVTLGAFRARTARINGRMFGAAIWLSTHRDPVWVKEADRYVVMLIELACAAIVRRRTALADTNPVGPSRLISRAS